MPGLRALDFEGGPGPPLRLSRRDYVDLLSELEQEAGSPVQACSPTNRRLQQRIPFHQQARVVLHGAGEAPAVEFTARCRNISQRGLAFLHGEPVEAGVRCDVVMLSATESAVASSGLVVRSRPLRGSVHEVGLRFDLSIELAQLLPADGVVGSISQALAALRRRAV